MTGYAPSLQGRDVAGLITYLDWDELRIDSMLPVYTEVVPLETDYRLYDYTVSVEYPEWATLTSEEVRKLEQIGTPVASELQVHSSVSVSRKQGMLDIAFVPIVKRDGKYLKLLSAKISITATPKVKGLKSKVKGTIRMWLLRVLRIFVRRITVIWRITTASPRKSLL